MPSHQPNVITPSSLITVKIVHQDVTRRYKLQYRELGPSIFPLKIRHLLSIKEDQEMLIERYSDSLASYVPIEIGDHAAYRQLARAAKAKSKVLIRVALSGIFAAKTATTSFHQQQQQQQQPQKQSQEPMDGPLIVSSSPLPPSSVVERPNHLDITPPAPTPSSTVTAVEEELETSKASGSEMTSAFVQFSSPCWVDCNKCGNRTSECHFHCDECEDGDFDLCPFCVESGIGCHDDNHVMTKRCMKDGVMVNHTKTHEVSGSQRINEPAKSNKTESEPAPSLPTEKCDTPHEHEPAKTGGDLPSAVDCHWVCNGCVCEFLYSENFVTCVNCPSYDLCIECLLKDKHGHNPLHEFRPNQLNVSTHRKTEITKFCRPGRNILHDAYCDGCDKRVNGIRHKCLDCPDWDYCDSCVKSARLNHPGHRFARLTNSIDNQWKSEPVHKGIMCDGPLCTRSRKYITGVRYKCTVCLDTDFCENCEAHPSNRHNETHPLIKIRTPVASLTVTTMGESAKTQDGAMPAARAVEEKKKTASESTTVSTVIDAATQVEALVPKPVEVKKQSEVPSPKQEPADKIVPLNGIFVGDTVPDGSKVYADQSFTQTWSVFNPGPKPWPKGVAVHYVGGDSMVDVDLTRPVGTSDLMRAMRSEPTEEVVDVFKTYKFTVNLKAPSRVLVAGETDRRISVWAIKDADGKAFGHKLWCDVTVLPSSFPKRQPSAVQQRKDWEKSQVIFPTPEQCSAASSRTAVSPEEDASSSLTGQQKTSEGQAKMAQPEDGFDIEDLSSDARDLSLDSPDYSYDTEDIGFNDNDSFATDDDFEILTLRHNMISSPVQLGTIRILVCDATNSWQCFSHRRVVLRSQDYYIATAKRTAPRNGTRQFCITPAAAAHYLGEKSNSASRGCSSISERALQLANAPTTTLPAPIEGVHRDAFNSSVKYYFALGKAYVSFYKTGMKNVYYNYKAAQKLREDTGLKGWSFLSPPIPETGIWCGGSKRNRNKHSSKTDKVAQLSRADFQLLHRSAYDMRRVLPFSLMLLVCGEMTPLVVLALGSLVVPKTCLIPRQIDSDEIAFARRKRKLVSLRSKWGDLKQLPHPIDLEKLDARSLRDAAIALNLASRNPHTALLPFIANLIYKPRLRKHIAYLAWDDKLILKYGGVSALSGEEVKRAVLERGGVHCIVLGNEEADRKWLMHWLSGRKME
ncbi:hypothetical protein KEM54_002346 [Ascosphaera aggregata]|nr:hypothetical protein KEM54_002346 [Ascosphaera aggregata]